MQNRIVAIGPKDMISCFAAIGAELHATRNAEEISTALEKTARAGNVALVLVPEAHAADCRPALRAFRAESRAALLLLPSSAEGPSIAFEEVGKEIEKAVGINLLKAQDSGK